MLRYEAFLHNISPLDTWVAPDGTRRNSPEWKPFKSQSLTASARDVAFSAIRSFFQWCRTTGYATLWVPELRRRAWNTVDAKAPGLLKTTHSMAHAVEPIDRVDMEWIWRAIAMDTGKAHRGRALAFLLGYYACLGVPALARAKWSDLRQRNGHWYLLVADISPAPREVLLLPPIVVALARMRSSLAAIAEVSDKQIESSFQARDDPLLPFGADAIPKHLRKVLTLAARLAREEGADLAAARLAELKVPALRYSLSSHSPTPRAKSLVRTLMGGGRLRENQVPEYFLPRSLSLTDSLAQEAVHALEFLWRAQP